MHTDMVVIRKQQMEVFGDAATLDRSRGALKKLLVAVQLPLAQSQR